MMGQNSPPVDVANVSLSVAGRFVNAGPFPQVQPGPRKIVDFGREKQQELEWGAESVSLAPSGLGLRAKRHACRVRAAPTSHGPRGLSVETLAHNRPRVRDKSVARVAFAGRAVSKAGTK